MKNFEEWHRFEINIENDRAAPFFRECEIWWCSLGMNIGFEEDGKNKFFEQPILVFHKFNKDMLWGLSMSSKEKSGKNNYPILFLGQKRTVLLSQMRILSSKRLIRRMGAITGNELKLIEHAMISLTITKTDPFLGSSGA